MRVMIRGWTYWLAPALLVCHGAAIAQYKLDRPGGYPNRSIRIIVAVAPGAGGDAMAQRLAADGSQPAERMTPEELRLSMAREYAKIEQQVKRLNIKLQ